MVGQRDESSGGAGSTTESIRQEAAGTAQAAKEQAGRVTEEAQRQGRRLIDEAGNRLRHEADGQASRAASSMRDISAEIRAMAEASDEPDGTVPRLMRDGADQLANFAESLDAEGWEAARSRVESLARRRPAIFLAGAFGVGMMAGRLFRNTDTDEVRRHMSGDDEKSPQGSRIETGVSHSGGTSPGTLGQPLPSDSPGSPAGSVDSPREGSS